MNNSAPDPMGSISGSLLEGLKSQSDEAWRCFADLYGPEIDRWCHIAGLQSADRADVRQDVLAAVARNIENFRRDNPGDSFRGWLWVITRSKLQDHWRRQKGRPEAVGGSTFHERLEELAEQEDASASHAGSGTADGVFRRAVELIRNEVEERTWQAFWRTAIDERPAAEVATELGMTEGGVYTARSRVLKRLRERMGGLLDESDDRP